MKQRADIVPYWYSADEAVNVSISLAKIHKRIRMIDPGYKRMSRYQARLKSKRAARRMKHGIVR